jgi:uncharacterized membrane protein
VSGHEVKRLAEGSIFNDLGIEDAVIRELARALQPPRRG